MRPEMIWIGFLFLLEGIRESEIIKQAIGLAQIENCDPEYMMQVLVNLMVCIKNGNCELPIRNFKLVIETALQLIFTYRCLF